MSRISLCTMVVCFTIGIFLTAHRSMATAPFPPEALPGVSIGDGLPDTPVPYEPSGAVWHTRLDRLMVVSDAGRISSMTSDGGGVTDWTLSGDLEAICVADPDSNFVYVGIERPNDSIVEFDISKGEVTRTFDLTTWMTGDINAGLEALTFVPDSTNPEGGLFYAGLQEDGKIYKFELPIVSSSTSTAVSYQGTITPVAGRTDLSGLHYDIDQEVLYAVFDGSNALRAMQADGTFLEEWQAPGSNQEGIALHDGALYISEDSGRVMRYSPFAGVPEPSTTVLLTMMATVGLVGVWRRSAKR